MSGPNRLCSRGVEFRAVNEGGDGRTLEGYAAVFDAPTRIESWEGRFDETIARGAFSKTIGERKPVLQFDHGKDARTGSVPIGSIEEIREDGHGLYVRARMFDNQVVEPIRQAIEGGAIDGMSFRFRVTKEDWHDSEGKQVRDSELTNLLYDDSGQRGPLQRTIREVELFEAGPVVFPAYQATSVGVRSLFVSLSDEERVELVEDLVRAYSAPAKKKDDEDAPKKGDDADPKKKSGGKKCPTCGQVMPAKGDEKKSLTPEGADREVTPDAEAGADREVTPSTMEHGVRAAFLRAMDLKRG